MSGSGLIRMVYSAAGATNSYLNNLGGFTGMVELANSGSNGDKWNWTSATINPAASIQIDNGSQFFMVSPAR